MKTQVYFAAAQGRIKIGSTSKPISERLKAISAHLAVPLDIIAVIDGDLAIEREVQKFLKPFHLSGEWFSDCPAARSVIENIILHAWPPVLAQDDHAVIPFACRRRRPRTPRDEVKKLRIRRLITLIWPDGPIKEFAAFTEQAEELCIKWADGEEKMPRLVALAFGARLIQFIMEDELPPAAHRSAA